MLEEVSWSLTFKGGKCFLMKNEKAMPSVTGQFDLHFVGRISPAKQDEK